MPPRKEPKENVVYAASKRKAPPFKPHRPSQVPRIPTTESEASTASRPAVRPALAKRKLSVRDDSEDESAQADAIDDDDSDEELADNPLTARPRPAAPAKKPPAKRNPPRQPSPVAISDGDDDDAFSPLPDRDAAASNPPPEASQPDSSVSIPQPLLTRLLHEHFADKSTQIDKQALQVFQKYIETFVQEAIARAALQKRAAAEAGMISEMDAGWLELDDLEKVAGGLVLDF
ncbi:uncharacterized protein LTR77_009665 [Saxophila tyrrhenica]|uniref:CENP-S associating centromere protein X-domain-containing protein n=1 Tax=Saxophila tyrrhenica TaxID=1690608 RepID=A0AAV9NWV7_9PEZI|nr:hypothetical protein LTR77_009665 [Saxophila tyrrhenica]